MNEIFNELSVIGDKVTEEDHVVYILASFSDFYNTLITALEAIVEVPTMDVVTEWLLYEERKQTDCVTSSGEKAMAVKTKNKTERTKMSLLS